VAEETRRHRPLEANKPQPYRVDLRRVLRRAVMTGVDALGSSILLGKLFIKCGLDCLGNLALTNQLNTSAKELDSGVHLAWAAMPSLSYRSMAFEIETRVKAKNNLIIVSHREGADDCDRIACSMK
jgi:hypothetical protein